MDYSWKHDYPQIARDAGFKLKQIKEGELDWRLLGTIDVDNLVRNQHLERLDTLIHHVANAPLAKILDSNVLDSGVVKYFHLAQLSVQYLLFCKGFLDETLTGVRSTLRTLRTENIELKELNKETNDELLKLHKKLQKIEDINQIVYPCSLCPKNFISNEMLDTHIKRKHAKGAGKTAVENDTNLINTIKLELEIKHLKERLNIAEREIREKQNCNRKDIIVTKEMKIDSSTITSIEHQAYTVATQTDISTRNIGIQSNLEEPKELDESDDSNKHFRQEIISELHEKLAGFEEWKKKEALDSEQSINLIKTKVNDMLNSVDQKLKEIQESGKVSDENIQTGITEADLKEMQRMFSENLTKICKESELKLNNAIKTFEIGYKRKLEGLESLIERYEGSLQMAAEKVKKRDEIVIPVEKYDRNIESSKPASIMDVRSSKPVSIQSITQVREVKAYEGTDSEEEPSEKMSPQVPSTRTVFQEESLQLSSLEEDSEESESKSNQDLKQSMRVSNEGASRSIPRPKTAAKPSKRKESEERVVKRDKPDPQTIRQSAMKLFRKRLRIFGIGSNTKAISKHSKDEVTEMLIERRNTFRKKHPNYFATRNKLKETVNKLAKERIQSTQQVPSPKFTMRSSAVPKRDESHPNNRKDLKVLASVHSIQSSGSESEELSNKDNINVDEDGQEPPTPKSEKKDMDQFKARLERILASPIRKPTVHVRTSTPTQILSTSTPTEVQSNGSLKKPIPTPRKKVMFDINSSDNGSNHDKTEKLPATVLEAKESESDQSDSELIPMALKRKDSSEASSLSSLLK